MKVEKTDWPAHVQTEEEKVAYLEGYEQVEKIKLDRNQIENNPGLRELAKLMLNSFWGKVIILSYCDNIVCFFQFGQRTNLSKTEMIKNLSRMWDVLNDSSMQVQSIVEMTPLMVLMKYQAVEQECEDIMTNTNVVIAAFTTAYARLELYKYMEKLGDRVLYTDTG